MCSFSAKFLQLVDHPLTNLVDVVVPILLLSQYFSFCPLGFYCHLAIQGFSIQSDFSLENLPNYDL